MLKKHLPFWNRCSKIISVRKWLGVAQFGSVLEWGSRGRRFNSCHPDQRKPLVRKDEAVFAVLGKVAENR